MKYQVDKYLVDAQQEQIDVNNLWQVIRTTPYSQTNKNSLINQTEIHYDDCIVLRHYITCRYLTNYGDIQSQTTKQGEMCCMNDSMETANQIFMFQRLQDPYIDALDPNIIIDNRVYSHTKMRIISVSDDRALHSHFDQYSQSGANKLKEVTSYPLRDNNDFWELQIADEQLLKSFKLKQNNNINAIERFGETIYHLDKVMIRSCLMGASLHSIAKQYLKGTKEQEVTCRVVQPRDENDWWQIVAINEKFYQIQHLGKVGFIHSITNKYLTASQDLKGISGQKVFCKQGSPQEGEWQLIGLTMYEIQKVVKSDQEIGTLPLGYPFLIKHILTGQYLAVFKGTSKSSDTQKEIGLVDKSSHATLWQIEQQDSKFF